jgi:hypothetical protein
VRVSILTLAIVIGNITRDEKNDKDEGIVKGFKDSLEKIGGDSD